MKISRRFFLGGVLSVVAGQLIKPTFALPTIYANGIDDDTAGLNALFSGRAFHAEDSGLLVREGGISNARLVISDTIVFNIENINILNCDVRLIGNAIDHKLPTFDGRAGNCMIANCHFRYFDAPISASDLVLEGNLLHGGQSLDLFPGETLNFEKRIFRD